MPTASEMLARSTEAMARRFADDACRSRHESLTRAALFGLSFIEALKEAGGCDIRATLGTVIDALSDAAGSIEKDADNHGIAPECFPLDMTELNALWRQVDGGEPLFGDVRRLHRFPEVSCSQCGQSFGPGDHGFSHCKNHSHLRSKR